MRILLISMPDTANVIDYVSRLPNLALVSIAGSLPNHDVRVLDLVLAKPRIRAPLQHALNTFQPQLVGLSGMTFQFNTLLRIARFIKQVDPSIRLAAGGYHASLMATELAEQPELPLDFLVRGEGEATFSELANAMEQPEPDLASIRGLSFRRGAAWTHNPARELADLSALPLPRRQARLLTGFSFLGRSMDVAETSRGCPYECKFCSITRMYGRSFRTFPIERIVADLEQIKAGGARAVFLADDNITHDIDHFMKVCEAITRHGLHSMMFAVQATATGLAHHPDLVAAMDRANFRTVFVGFESMLPSELKGMRKPTTPDINLRAAALLRQHHMGIIAGIIVGHPDDDESTIARNFRLFRAIRPDMLYAQYLTPYPKTPLRDEMLSEGLVANIDDYTKYDGFTCNVRTRHLTREALHRALKRECIRFIWRPSHLVGNYYLRHYPVPIALSALRVAVSDLFTVLAARRWPSRFDL